MRFIENCINSILSLKPSFKIEIIVYDNNSNDGTPELIKEKFSDIQLFCGENLGYGGGNNVGIRASRGRYVLLLNDDTLIIGECLEKIVKYMEEHPVIGMLGPKLLNMDESLQPSITNYPTAWKDILRIVLPHKVQANTATARKLFNLLKRFLPEVKLGRFDNHEKTMKVEGLKGACLLIRKKAVNQVGFIDEVYFFHTDEIDWSYRFNKANWDVVYFPDASVIHFGGQTVGSDDTEIPERRFLQKHKSNLRFFGRFRGTGYNLLYKIGMSIALLTRIFQLSFALLIASGDRVLEIKQEREAYDKTLQILWNPSFRRMNMLTEVKFVNSKMDINA